MVTAASEIARNTVEYGGGGTLTLEELSDGGKKGLRLVFADHGPGIADLDLAMKDGYTFGSGLGLGLGGARRLASEFTINSVPGEGTTVTLTKRIPAALLTLTGASIASIAEKLIEMTLENPFSEIQQQNQELIQTLH